MANLLSRILASFAAAAPVSSLDPLDDEFNQLVGGSGAFNGGGTSVKLLTRASDASDPPYDLDQLGAGLLARWKQNGVEKAKVGNDGSFETVDQFISTVATGTAPLAVSSTTVCTNLNADKVDGIEASSFVRLDDSTLQAIISDLRITKNFNPALWVNNTTFGTQFILYVDNTGLLHLNVDGSTDILNANLTTKIATFTQIPVGPASDPATANQLTRKSYVDDKSFWSANWFIADPSTFPLNSFNSCQKVLIPKGNIRALTLHGIFNTGSASGSFSVELRKHPFSDQATQTTLGTITFNSGTLGVGVDVDIADHEFTEKDWLYLVLTARSSPAQRDISISVIGDKLGTV